jgi:hypothetical protein
VALLRSAAFALLLAATPVLAAPTAGVEGASEYAVKAAFLLNFARPVEWPDSAFAAPSDPVVVGILGAEAFEAALAADIEKQRVGARAVRLERLSGAQQAAGCHVVFVSSAEHSSAGAVLAALGGASVLTVGESDGFARQGGIVNFYHEGKKIRFEINPAAADRAGIRISSRLLRLARIVAAERR